MNKSTPISHLKNNNDNPNLVDEILNGISDNTESDQIIENQKIEQANMEEQMLKQIGDQTSADEVELYEQQQEHEQQEHEQHEQQEHEQHEQQEHEQQEHQHQEHQQLPQPEHEIDNNLIKSIDNNVIQQDGILDIMYNNIKPTVIVFILSLLFSVEAISDLIKRGLPNKEFIIKYNKYIVILLKSIISSILFFITNIFV